MFSLMLCFLIGSLFPEKQFSKWNAGISFGPDYNWLLTGTSYRENVIHEMNTGIIVSGTLAYRFTRHLGVSTGLSWTQKNYTRSCTYLNQKSFASFTNTFVEMPIFFDFSFGSERTRFVTSAGGYFGYWTVREVEGEDVIYDGYASDSIASYEESAFNGTRDNRFEAGLIARLGCFFTEDPLSVYLGVAYAYALTDLSKNYQKNTANKHNSTITAEMGLSLAWGGNKK